ncbi:ADP-ribosylglycohydrolase family protein [Candidatus Sumerlaeota bacterium]|nr:ADP-ribosylglycohydrolase family protein [Candidatus Sumerlaeota bacterium]
MMEKSGELYSGFFAGMAIGDALGAPAQGLKPARVAQLFGLISDFLDPDEAFERSPRNWRSKGLYSFPTQQALAVAEFLIISNLYDARMIREILLTLFTERGGLYRGMDEIFHKAMNNTSLGGDLFSAAAPHPGIGAISRCLPLALFFKNNDEELRRAIIETSLLTHNDPRAIAGAAALTRVASLLIRDPNLPKEKPEEMIEDIRHFTRKSEEFLQDHYREHLPAADMPIPLYYAMSDSLRILPMCLKEKNKDLVKQTILTEANRHQPPFGISVVNQDFAPSAVCYLLYALLTSRTFGMGVLDVINEGKESRAMGALIGGLSGVRFGRSVLPEGWLDQIENSDQIILRGKELYQGFPDWNERRDFILLEREFTEKEGEEIRRRREGWMREKERAKEREKTSRASKMKQTSGINPNLPPQEDAPFAPPPSVVFGNDPPDPWKVKKDKALRGRKRIEWKENRRRSKKRDDEE